MIVNNSRIKGLVTFAYALSDNIFSNEEIDKILNYIENNKKMEDGNLSGGDVDHSIRTSLVQFFYPDSENIWFFEKFNDYLNYVNNTYYNFDLWGYDFIQYAEYLHTNNGKYDYHTDMLTTDINQYNKEIFNLGTRKLSATILLSEPETDFSGGEFQMTTASEEMSETINAKKGSVIVFPSFFLHRVKPVITGTRKSITAWVTGPKFR